MFRVIYMYMYAFITKLYWSLLSVDRDTRVMTVHQCPQTPTSHQPAPWRVPCTAGELPRGFEPLLTSTPRPDHERGEPSTRRHRYNLKELSVLQEEYRQSPYCDTARRDRLAKRLGLSRAQIQVLAFTWLYIQWWCNYSTQYSWNDIKFIYMLGMT